MTPPLERIPLPEPHRVPWFVDDTVNEIGYSAYYGGGGLIIVDPPIVVDPPEDPPIIVDPPEDPPPEDPPPEDDPEWIYDPEWDHPVQACQPDYTFEWIASSYVWGFGPPDPLVPWTPIAAGMTDEQWQCAKQLLNSEALANTPVGTTGVGKYYWQYVGSTSVQYSALAKGSCDPFNTEDDLTILYGGYWTLTRGFCIPILPEE